MICIKTEMKDMPKNCSECWVLCELPCENNSEENIIKEEYFNKRHNNCPLIEIKMESKLLESLHEKILKSSFAEEVTEREIDALIEVKKISQ